MPTFHSAESLFTMKVELALVTLLEDHIVSVAVTIKYSQPSSAAKEGVLNE